MTSLSLETLYCILDGAYNDEEEDAIPEDVPVDDDDEDNPNKVIPLPKASAFFIFSSSNRCDSSQRTSSALTMLCSVV